MFEDCIPGQLKFARFLHNYKLLLLLHNKIENKEKHTQNIDGWHSYNCIGIVNYTQNSCMVYVIKHQPPLKY